MIDGAKALPSLVLALLLSAPCLAAEAALPTEGADETGQGTDEMIVPPRILANTQTVPEYPPAALAARFQGTVVVRLTVQRDGTVRDVEAAACDHPNLGFEKASIAAVQDWRFKPAIGVDGPVAYPTSFRLSFRLEGRSGKGQVTVLAGTGNTESTADRNTVLLRMQPSIPSTIGARH